MLAKAGKSSFNANIGEFCSLIFSFVLFCFFHGALIKLLGYISTEFRHI